MDYQEYARLTDQISQLMSSARWKEAGDALYSLLLGDISDLDKAAICAKLAKVYDRMGTTEEVLSWFDKGIVYEQAYCRYEIAEEKVRYLTQIGHSKEAVPICEALLKEPFLTEAEKERIRNETKSLLGKAIGQWH